MALAESSAFILADTDDIADEVIDNALVFCNILLEKVAQIRDIPVEDVPQLYEEFEDIPDELRETLSFLVPATSEWRNRH